MQPISSIIYKSGTQQVTYILLQSEDGALNKVSWLLTDSLECRAQLDGSNPIFSDASHGTNIYASKFAIFTTIDKHGKSQILACSLIDRETIDSYIWIFTQFLQSILTTPKGNNH